jgi:uncharacterized protein
MRTANEIVKAHYDANDRRDFAGMLADFGPETQWTEMAGLPCAGTYIGRDAIVANVFDGLSAKFDDYTFKLERVMDAARTLPGLVNTRRLRKKPARASARAWRIYGRFRAVKSRNSSSSPTRCWQRRLCAEERAMPLDIVGRLDV